MNLVHINERSWAIDLISEINRFVADKKILIGHAGGESTLKNASGSLFPDVLLFSDPQKSEILQGWELKMPDTSINDVEFYENARKKAELLKLDSFLLWNVRSAVLYLKASGTFQPIKTWAPLSRIKTRKDVEDFSADWKELLKMILTDLNDYFVSGQISTKKLIDNLSLNEFIEVILSNTAQTSVAIENSTAKNRLLGAEINLWWSSAKSAYNDDPNRYEVLSRQILTDWLIKFVFAHIIKKHFNAAREVDKIDFDTTVEEGIQIFEAISATCNFRNIFSSGFGQNEISARAWDQLIQINQFLKEINVQSIDMHILHEIFQQSILVDRRKVAGQYSTPPKLAELLVKITVEDVTDHIIDPTCGTGTIGKEVYQLKESAGLSPSSITTTTWASDKYAFPLQLATLALSKPDNFGLVLQVFRKDATDLHVNDQVMFINPANGEELAITLPEQGAIVANLPFVQQEDLKVLNPNIGDINEWIKAKTKAPLTLDGRSDLFVYIPFYLYELLKEEGKMGFILSNAWLGTEYGRSFIALLKKLFHIETIVISGKGKWFENAAVVTTILVLKKTSSRNLPTKFCTLNENVTALPDIDQVADSMLLSRQHEAFFMSSYTEAQINELELLSMPWSAYFADLTWLPALQKYLVPVKAVFTIGRGERRGWNPMFYPEDGHGIEQQFLKPVLKNLRSCKGLIATANKQAFCCSLTRDELLNKGLTGALNWIKKFEGQSNEKGKPLTEALARSDHHWYEMKTDTLADFAVNINYDKSLFIAKLEERSFVDQKIIALITNPAYKMKILIFCWHY